MKYAKMKIAFLKWYVVTDSNAPHKGIVTITLIYFS